jgi:RNA polymerase sigma-70 factor (ECF subfamily)
MQISLTELVDTYGNQLCKLATAQLNNRSDALDVVQDVFLKVHVKNPDWNCPDHVKAWLIRATVNRCRDYNRRAGTVELHEVFDVSRSAPDYDLQDALANLPQKYRIVLYLHYYEGYKISEIASTLKIGESGIKKRLVVGREKLKNYLTEELL